MATKRVAIIGNQAFSMLNFRGPLIQELAAQGIEIHAFAPDYDYKSRQDLRDLGAIPVDHGLARTGMNPFRDAAGALDLVGKLRRLKPDLVLGYSIKPAIYGTLAAWLAGVPKRFVMIEGLGHVFMHNRTLTSRLLRSLVSALYRLALPRSTKVLFLNSDDRADFIRLGLVDPAKSTVVGAIGIDLTHWPASTPVPDPMTFLFVGRILREKGVGELIEAMRMVKSRHDHARLVLLGDVDSNPSSFTRAEVQSWVSEGLLVWPGHVAVAPWLAQASVFVLPSYREGVPRSTQEAMAMGRPVITTDVPGCRDTVVNGVNGYLVPAKDSKSLADAMERFVAEPSLVQTMGQESRRIAVERFDASAATARLTREMGL